MNDRPGQFLAEGYPTAGQSRNPRILVSINSVELLGDAAEPEAAEVIGDAGTDEVGAHATPPTMAA